MDDLRTPGNCTESAEANKDNTNVSDADAVNGDVSAVNGDVSAVSGDVSAVDDSLIPDLTNKLPYDVLLLLFSWLSIKDLFTVRRVCHSWRVAAKDEYRLKDYVLTVYGVPDDYRKVESMPNRNIAGCSKNFLIYVILDNVIDLRNLNVTFYPPISSLQIALVLEKYPEIESITLSLNTPDILECLEILKTGTHLKEIVFEGDCVYSRLSPTDCINLLALSTVDILETGTHLKEVVFEGGCEYSRLSPSNLMKIFTDCRNFPALTTVDISDYYFRQSLKENSDHESFENVVADIIVNRSQQLLSLKLCLYYEEYSEVLNAVNQCVKLQVLDLSAHFEIDNIDFGRMTNLKLLNLNVYALPHAAILKCFNSGSWIHLTEVCIHLHKYSGRVLQAIIDNAKHLRKLTYRVFHSYEGYISEDELKHVGSLLKLESLHIKGLYNISEKLISFLSKSYNLTALKLITANSEVGEEDPCIIEMLQQLNNLCFIHLTTLPEDVSQTNIIYLCLHNKEAIERYIKKYRC